MTLYPFYPSLADSNYSQSTNLIIVKDNSAKRTVTTSLNVVTMKSRNLKRRKINRELPVVDVVVSFTLFLVSALEKIQCKT